MVAMQGHGRLLARQSPTALTGVLTIATDSVETMSDLAVNTAASTNTAVTVAPLITDGTPRLPAPTSTSAAPTSSDVPTTVAASSTKQISMKTVVATCVGAFAGATALIIFAFWMYRRYSRSLKQRSYASRGARNGQNITDRRRSHTENWNRLEDQEDKWEKTYHAPERQNSSGAEELTQVAPMEKLTMFKKTPSVRTAYTHKSTEGTDFSFPSSYADFDPKLAEALKSSDFDMPEPKPFVKRQDSDPGSYLTMHSRMSGAMSPTPNIAIPTPPPMFSDTHKWEQAEVVGYQIHEAQSAEVVNPFEDEEEERRRSHHNPFFGARDHNTLTRGRSNSTSSARSRSRSRSRNRANANAEPVPPLSVKAKGKQRMRYSTATEDTTVINPFEDNNDDGELPRPVFMTHAAASSTSSMDNGDRERALQSLIAALDVPEDEVRDRLRIASMQPSVMSRASSIGVQDVAAEFPLPPSVPAG